MGTYHIGGTLPAAADPLLPRFAYFVRVCGFTFEFVSLDQIDECAARFAMKPQPPTRRQHDGLEHYWQAWHERLPQRLFGESKRARVLAALRTASAAFRASPSDTRFPSGPPSLRPDA